jgi:flagellar motor switch protein FliM
MNLPEQLTQSQIDALLNKMMSMDEVDIEEEVDSQKSKIKEYDFTSPKKFTKEQLRALDGLYEIYARLLSSYLSGLLRTVVNAEVLQIEELRYFEYNNALPDNALVGILDFVPEDSRYSESNIMVDMSTTMGFYLIDRLLGGSGAAHNFTRDYTEIEVAILTNVMNKMVSRMQDAWNTSLAVGITLNSIETNSRLLQVYSPDDIVVVIVLDVEIGGLSTTLSVCLPAESLEEFIDNFTVRFYRSTKRQDPEREQKKRRILLEGVFESDMDMKVVFHEFHMELKDLLSLQPDDVIPLTKTLTSDVIMEVGGIPWFTAKLGETKGKKSVKLNNPLG